MARIIIEQNGQVIECEEEALLLPELLRAGIYVENLCNGKGTCGKCEVYVNGRKQLACETYVQSELYVSVSELKADDKVLVDGYLPSFEIERYTNGYGAALDIGTTTVVAEIVDLMTGKQLTSAAIINPQKKYGMDVMTRISYEYEYTEDGIRQLQQSIVKAVNQLLEKMCCDVNVSPEEILKITVSANCTMMHMFMGKDARGIGKAPYRPQFLKAQRFKAGNIGIHAGLGESAEIYCLPQVSAFIGADILAGVCVCELEKQRGNVLFIDIGTNGEIVLARQGRLLCCSCAAGPALEGMSISCGMRAVKGAVEDVHITETGVQLDVIGGGQPIGICGSGILAVIKEMLRTGIIKRNGVFAGKSREYVLQQTPKLSVTQKDVRQVQLAKGALLSGIQALLKYAGITDGELDKVIIAGQFGVHLPEEVLIDTGILPQSVMKKVSYVGNTSQTGAYMALMSERVRTNMEKLAEKIEYIELAEIEDYDHLLAQSMMFP